LKRAIALALALATSGCMVGPNYHRPETSLPGAFSEADVGTATVPVPHDWWTLYSDPALNDLVAAGLANNTDVQVAAARVEEAEAALREARATLLFPLVNGQASAFRGRDSDTSFITTNGFGVGLATSFEVDLWGRLRRAERSVRDQLLASRYGRDTVALTLAATVARSYFAARSLDAQEIASREILSTAVESLGLAKKRSDAGVAPELDVYQAGSLRAQAAAQATEIARQRDAIVHQLGVLTGRLDLKLPEGGLDQLPIPPLTPAGLPSLLLERRPDVREAEANLQAATERIGVARAEQFPTLSLTGTLGTASTELGNLFTTGARSWSVGGTLIGPIIDGGRYKARTDQAVAQAKQAEGAYVGAVRNAFRDVSDALSNVRRANESDGELKDLVDQAGKALHLAQLRYEHGYSAYLEVLDAERTLNDARLQLIRNRQAYLSFTVDLMNALGGGWKPTDS
jgi:multidrug efflux system outer membrane protein